MERPLTQESLSWIPPEPKGWHRCWRAILPVLLLGFLVSPLDSADKPEKAKAVVKASTILGSPDYPAFAYGGYRQNTRKVEPSIEDLKDDMRILSAMGVKLVRTYNTQQFPQAENLLKAIRQIKDKDPAFEMYVMLGAWIECEGAWTGSPNHAKGSPTNNPAEIQAAVTLAKAYPDIVKMIAVGNEAMIQWATGYFVQPGVVLQWVEHLQGLKAKGELSPDIWITSSDNYEAWGGGAPNYKTQELAALIKAVDFISLHTFPMHDTHYRPGFWVVPVGEEALPLSEKIQRAMLRARELARKQYSDVADHVRSLGLKKPICIGETGWTTAANYSYGTSGSRAADEYKSSVYYRLIREWTRQEKITCFYFEAFDEQWKESNNAGGPENHFGLIDSEARAKYALWESVDKGLFKSLTRNGEPITKTYGGDEKKLMAEVQAPPLKREIGILETQTINKARKLGQPVTEGTYVVLSDSLVPDGKNDLSYPSAALKPNVWDGTCQFKLTEDGVLTLTTGSGAWWGCALEIPPGGPGEDLTLFKEGNLNFEIKGTTTTSFKLGFQTGTYSQGSQVNNFVMFGPGRRYTLTETWTPVSIPIAKLDKGANLANLTGVLFFLADAGCDGKQICVRNIHYSRK